EHSLGAVRTLARGRPLVIRFGARKNTALPAMLAHLRTMEVPVIFSAIGWHRAAPPAQLAEAFGEASETAESSRIAIDRARERAGANGIVFVCGSLYLVGEALAFIRARQRTATAGKRV